MTLITDEDLHLDLTEPSPAELRRIEIALAEWEKSDIPETRKSPVAIAPSCRPMARRWLC